MEVVNLRDKSFCVRTSVYLDYSDTPLFTAHLQFIIMDKKTRKATVGPDWLRELQSHVTTQSEGLRPDRLPVEGRPPVSSEYSQSVSASDVDPYAHLSWAHAVKFCCNALVLHLARDGGQSVAAGLDRKVKSLTASYLKEVPLGAKLGVSIWAREGSADFLDFQIQRDRKVTTEVLMELFPKENVSKI